MTRSMNMDDMRACVEVRGGLLLPEECLFLLNEVKRLTQDLEQLRSAWNAHFKDCPAPMLNIPQPTWEQLQEWASAPSDTASA